MKLSYAGTKIEVSDFRLDLEPVSDHVPIDFSPELLRDHAGSFDLKVEPGIYQLIEGKRKVCIDLPESAMKVVAEAPTGSTLTLSVGGRTNDFLIKRRDYKRNRVWAVVL